MPVVGAGGGAKSAKSFEATIDSEVLLHGEDHAAVARARSNYGEWLLNEGDVGAARYQLECAYRIQGALSGPGVITEDLVDAHYRVGRAIAAESRVTGSNSVSKAHFLKTLAMREDYDAKVALDRVTGSRGGDDQTQPTLSSAMDSTLIYADLAETERVAANYKDASLLYLKSLKLRRSKFGDVSAPVAQVLVKYGDILRLSLKYNESKAAIEEALAIYMHIFGPKHVQTTEAMNNLGQMQRLLGSLEEAEALLLESLNIRREMHGDFHVSTASSLNNLAEVCREKEDFFQAINYHNAAIDAFSKAVGDDHPGTMNAKGNLGVTLRRQAKQSSDMGQVLVREAMDYLKAQQYDAEHPWMAKFDTEHAMAQAEHLASEGRHEESLQLYEALINKKHIVAQLTSTVGGAAAPTASLTAGSSKRAAQDVVLLTEGKVQALMKRAHMLESKHKMREAAALYHSFIEPSRKVLGLDNLVIYRSSVAHGLVLLRLAQYDAAAEVIQEALQARIDLRGPDDVEVTEASFALAEVFRVSANFDGASALYVHCMEVLSEALRKDPFSKEKSSKSYPFNERFVRVTLGLAKVQASKCVITRARTLLSQGKETALRTLGEEHALYCDLEFLEADLHFECGNYTEAVAAHKACLAKRVAIGSHKIYSSLHQLARISLALCDFPRAAGYLDESLGLVSDLFSSPSASARGEAEAEAEDDPQQQQHPSLLRLHHTKAQLLLAVGSYFDAHKLIESTLVSRRIALGARHNRVADSLVVLAQLAHARGLPNLAQQPLEDALDVYRELFVYDMHKQVCTCRVELAVNAMQGGRYSQAVETLQDVRDKRIEFFNKMGVEKHVEIAQASALLSRAMVLSGASLEAADKLASEAGAMLSAALELSSPPHVERRFAHLLATDCLEALAAVATARGRYKDSRALLSHSLALRNNALPPTHHSLCALFLQAVENNTRPGYCAASQSVAARVADHVGTHFGSSSSSQSSLFVAQARLMQAQLLLLPVAGLHYNNEKRQDAAAAAEPLLAQALAVVRDSQGEDNVLYAQITAELGSCVQARGKDKFAAADQLLRQALAVLTRLHNATMHIHCIEVQLRIAALLVERVQEEEALPMLTNQIIPALSEHYGDEHPVTIYAKGLLGVCLNDKKKGSGLENVRTSLLQLEDYGQGPFTADHPYVLRVGGFETAAKSRSSDSAAMQAESYQPLAHWAFPQLALIEQSEEEKRVAALYASDGGETKPLTRSFFNADAPVPEAEAVQVLEPEGWGAVGSRRRGNIKGKRELPVIGALFRPLLAATPPYAIGSGDCCSLAVGILQGAVPVAQEAIYDAAAAAAAAPSHGASSPSGGAESKQRVRGAFGKLQQMAAENAAKEAAASAAAEAEEEKGVRSKLSEVRQELEAEEARLADVRLQKVAEEAETEELRQAREQEEAEIQELVKQKKAEELAIVSLLTRKETEAAEAATLTAARQKHEKDLARVADELMAKMEEVAQAEETLKKLRAKHVSVQSMPERAEGDEGSLAGGGDNDEQSVVSESIPSAVAVVVSDEVRSSSPQQVPTADAVHQPSGSGGSTGGGSSSKPKALSESEQKRAQALDAAAFMLTRASELMDAGWFLKARPMLEECVRIRAKHLMLQPGHLDAIYTLALNLVLCDDYHAAFPLIEEALQHRVEQHAKRATKSKEDEGAGEGEEDSGAKMIDETQSKHTIEIAELTQLQAWNYLCVGKYLKAGAKMSEAAKMFIELVGDAHHKTGRCFAQQAYVLARLGRFDEAKAVAERSFSILNKVYGTKDAATTLGMMARVHVAVACGRNKEAKPLLEQCISMRKRLCGEQHPLTAECFSYLGQTLMQQSRLSEAERWFDQAREALVSRVDDHSLAVADVDYHKAQMLIIYGRLGEAATLLQRVLERRRKWLPQVLDPEEIAANTPKVKTEEELDAEADLELKTGKKAEPFKPKLPVTHSGIQDCLESLGRINLLLGELSKAEAAFKEVGRLRKEYCTEEASTDGTLCHPDLASNFFWKAECARVLGQYEQARPIHELASEMRQKSLGKEHLDSLQSAAVLANLQAGSGLLEEADKSYKRVLKRIKECLSDDHHLYADVQCAHADCLRRLGRLEMARKQLDDSTAARRMLFGEKNPDHLAFVEAANNNALLEMEELLAPPPPPAPEDQEADQTAVAAVPATEEEEAEAAAMQALQVKSKQQARISAQADDEETVVSSLPPADRAATDDLDEQARQTLLLEQAQAIEEGGGFDEEKEEEAVPEPFSRDAQGVPLFDNSAYEKARQALRVAIATLVTHYTPLVPGSDAVQHLWTVNLQGNIGIITKLEWEELQRFLFSLTKEDRKAFRRRERRLAKLAALAQKSAALVQADNASTFTEAPAPAAAASADAPAPTPAPDAAAAASADSAQLLDDDGDDDEDEEGEESQKKKKKAEPDLPPGTAEIEAAIAALQARGLPAVHPWISKFLSYRVIVEPPPDELGISLLLLDEAALLSHKGFFSATDLKLDEALSLLIDFLGDVKAETNAEVARCIMLRAQSALTQNRLEGCKKGFMQAYYMFCKIESPECEGACKCLFGLAELLRLRGLSEDSKLLHERVLRLRTALFGSSSIEVATSQASLSLCLADLGALPEALAAANKAVATCEAFKRPAVGFEDDYLYAAQARLVLGRVLLARGELPDASEQLKAALELQVGGLGADHVRTGDFMHALAELRFCQCKLLDARKLVGQALKIRLKTLGRVRYLDVKLKATARAFLDKSPEQDDSSLGGEEGFGATKRLVLVKGAPAPSAADAFGGRATLDADLGSLIASSVESITGSAASVASSRLSVKEEKKKGFYWRGNAVYSHTLLADTLHLRGDICLALGDLKEAREMIEGAYAVRSDLFGKRAVPSAKSLAQMARLVAYLGVPTEALSLHTIAYHLRLQLLGDAHPDVGDSCLALGRTRLVLCRLDESSAFLQDAKAILKASVGTAHYRHALVLAAEADLLLARADYIGATSRTFKALEVLRATFRDVHPSIASVLLTEGRVSLCQGVLDVAQVKIEQAISQRGVFFGDGHVAVAEAKHWAAHVLREQGKVLEAKPLVESVLLVQRDQLGKHHHDTVSTLTLLAFNMLDLGKYSEAAPVFERAAQLLRRSLGEDTQQATWALFGLGEAKLAEASWDKGRDAHIRAAAARKRMLSSEEHPLVLQSRHALTLLDVKLGRVDEATKALDDLLALRRMSDGQMHPDVATTLFELGEVLRVRGKLTEARSMHERALKMRRTVLGVDHPAIVDSQLAIAQLFVAFGRLEQGAAMIDRCLSNYRLKRGSRHPSVAKSLLLLGQVHLTLANFDASRAHLLDALMLRKSTFLGCFNHPDVAECVSALGDWLRATGSYMDTAAFDSAQAAAQPPAALTPLVASTVELAHTTIEQQQQVQKKAWGAANLGSSGSLAGSLVSGKANEGGGGADDASAVSGVSGPGNEGPLQGGSVSQLDVAGASIGGLSRSVASLPFFGGGAGAGEDNKSVDVETVHVSRIEERLSYVSLVDFLDDGQASLQETGGVARPSASLTAKEQTSTSASTGAGKGAARGDGDGEEESRQGDYEEEQEEHCLPLYERALDMVVKKFGLNHHRTLAAQHDVALTLLLLGHLSLAHDLLLHVVIERRALLGDEHLDTAESCAWLGEALRLMSRVFPENTAEAAEKRKNPKVDKALGPSLIQHLASILGPQQGLKRQWPPEASSALVLLDRGKTTTETMHPLLSPPKRRMNKGGYQGGFQGYAYPEPKKIKRVEWDSRLTRPPKTFYHDAKWVLDTGATGAKRALGDVAEHPLLSQLTYCRAELMRARRRPDLAIPLFEEALAVRRKLFRASHPAIADCLMGLAEIFRVDNKFSRSQPLLEKALEIRASAFAGSKSGGHASVGEVQCSLAMLLFSLGQYVDAEPLFAASLATRERLLGASHIATAQTLNNFAGLLHTLGRFDEALPMYRRVVAIKTATFGEGHPDVASSQNNLALLLKAMGQLDEAHALYVSALSSQQRVFGETHTDVAATLNNLAALEAARGNEAEAKVLYRQSLEIKRKVLGMDHPSVASTLNNLAGLCMACGDLEDAKDLYEDSLRLRRAVFGDDHPSVAESLNNIALLLFTQGQYPSALPLFERAIVIKAAAFGDSHVSTAASMHNLAIVLHKLKRFAEADAMYARALEIRSDRLGLTHTDTAATLSAIQELGRDRERLGSQEQRQLLALEKMGATVPPVEKSRERVALEEAIIKAQDEAGAAEGKREGIEEGFSPH